MAMNIIKHLIYFILAGSFRYLIPFCLLLISGACIRENFQHSPASQPYGYLQAEKTRKDILWSPDPLVNYEWKNPDVHDDLEIYTLQSVEITTSDQDAFKIIPNSKNATLIQVNGTGTIRFDFGQVNAAWLEFDSKDLSGKVEMSISEYNEPAILNHGAQNRIKTLEPVKYGNTYRLELNDQLYEGVRYGWIHVREFKESWHIDDVRLVCQIKPANYQGSFSSNDTLLNRIWYTGAYGVKLNLLQDHLGAILMERSDRHSWTGDAYPSQAASLVAFGNHDFIRMNLEHTARKSNGILSYSLYWVQSLYDYFTYTGDSATLRKYIENASDKLDLAYDHYGTDPQQNFYGWDERLGAGFENHSIPETQNAYKMLTISSWIKFSDMMEHIGEYEIASKYLNYATEKIDYLRKDSIWHTEFGIHAAAEAVNAGFTSEEEQKDIFLDKFSNRLNNLSYSPFNQYFIINAMAKMNRIDDALTTIRDCWGGQIKYGGTTFFEVYRPSWNDVLGYNDAPPNNQCGFTSLCHPWGGGVVKWLSEEILGIKPTHPGFLTCNISPQPGRTLTEIKGEVPTPHGTIMAEIDTERGIMHVVIPEKIQATINLPKVERNIVSIDLNGKQIWKQSKIIDPRFDHRIIEKENSVEIVGISGGAFYFAIEYTGETPSYDENEWIYSAEFVGSDSLTAGNFHGIYGNDGFIFCGFYPEKDTVLDYRRLPDFVNQVTYSKNLTKNWETNTDDERALSLDQGNSSSRNIGAISTRDSLWAFQTMTVDIETTPGKEYQTALYFVDFEDVNRRAAVEMFDLKTKELVAPVQLVQGFSGGKYMIYRYNNPVRFRINHVRGPNVTLSGIFFDSVPQ